ncbi:DUF3310 domain-containing protein [Actinomadura sp. NPDC048021]|uniref:DUF3310 domain-containing protein n=1 Tax=Actinomadura sp. NPDC048021 TaxID=3155385 RepID=UPI0033E71319
MNDYKPGQTYRAQDDSHWKVDDEGCLRLSLGNGSTSIFQDEPAAVEDQIGPLELVETPITIPGLGTAEQPVKDGLVHFPAAPKKSDPINHPSHYADGWSNGAEVIDLVEHLRFNRGAAVKYLCRAGKKGGPEKELEDLRKAQWFVNREVERLAASSGHQ